MFKKITSKLASLNMRIGGGKIVASALMMLAMTMVAQNAQAATHKYTVSTTRGTTWVNNYNIDWDTEKLVIKVDLTGLYTQNASLASGDQMLLAVCPSDGTLGWNAKNSLLYLSSATNVRAFTFNTDNANTTSGSGDIAWGSTTPTTFTYKKGDGLKMNGTQLSANDKLSDVFGASNIKVGIESDKSITANYEIWILPKDKDVPTNATFENVVTSKRENYTTTYHQADGWVDTYDIDWDTQNLVVSVNSIGSNYSNAQVFDVCGADYNPGWGYGFMCYNESSQFHYYMFTNDGNSVSKNTTQNKPSAYIFVFSKSEGLKCNGIQGLTASEITYITNFSKIKVGVTGPWSDATTFNYIRIVDKATGNVISESKNNNFSAQTNVNVQLQRKLDNTGWNTFCVPFYIDAATIASKFGEGTQLRTFHSMEGTTMNFVAATEIEAGKPYLIKPGNAEVPNPTFEGVDIVAGDPTAVEYNGYQMVGTYGLKTLTTDGTNLFLGDGDKFYKPEESNATMKGMRAYFVVPSSVNPVALVANIDGTETAIDQIEGAKVVENPNAPVYNLNGQRVGNSLNSLSRGVYIQNGKKYVVK